MCYAIIKVSYLNDKEPRALLEVETQGEMPTKISEIKGRPGVKSLTIFHPQYKHELVSEWRRVDYRGETNNAE